MQAIKIVTLIALVGVALVGCNTETSDNVNQDKIYAAYTHEYDKNTDVTSAFAQFRFSNAVGTVLEILPPALVTVTGQAMVYNATLGLYSKTFPGPQQALPFSYSDLDNNTFANNIAPPKAIGFQPTLDTISKSGAFELIWTGDNLAQGEVVTVGIWNNNNPLTQVLFVETSANNNKIILPQNRLAEVNTGTTTIAIQRESFSDLQQGTSVGGRLNARYKGQNKQVVIVN